MIKMLERLWRGIAIIYASPAGEAMTNRLARLIKELGVPVVTFKYGEVDVDKVWACYDAVIFIMALGGVVRILCSKVALSDKGRGPLVLVINDGGNYVIPILNSHYGANELATEIARLINAEAVITTATENLGLTSIEDIAKMLHCDIDDNDRELLPRIYDALLRGKPICIVGVDTLPAGIKGSYTLGSGNDCEYTLIVNYEKSGDLSNAILCRPYNVTIGIGLRVSATVEDIINAIDHALKTLGIDKSRVMYVASIKPQVAEAARILGLRFKLIDKDSLIKYYDPCITPPSPALKKLGIPGIAELSALYVAGRGSSLLLRKIAFKGKVTVAVAKVGR